MPTILLTNDDGVHSPGLAALAKGLASVGDLVTVAPDRNQSASGHSLTLTRPLRIDRVAENVWAVDGTPTDAVYLGINVVLKGRPPDLVVSGINLGANVADDVTYSGTVAAALEGMLLGVPAIAMSLAARRDFHFETAADFAREIALRVLEKGLPPRTFLNVNVPNVPPDPPPGVRITCQGTRRANDAVVDRTDPRGETYYWIGGEELAFESTEGTDVRAVFEDGLISVTPMRGDLTDEAMLGEIGRWSFARQAARRDT